MLPACAALVASLALQAGVTRYQASLQTQARYLTDLEALAPISTTALEVVPSLGLTYEERSSSFGVAYFPRLVLVVDSPPPQFFNQASLNVALQPSPGLHLSGSAIGCYGTNDFRIQYALTCGAAALPSAPGAGPQPIPQATTVKYLSASAALGLEWRTSARTALSASASYLAQGGADAPTRESLPLQRGPSFLVALAWTAGRGDVLTTSLSGSYYAILREAPAQGPEEPAANAWISQVLELWQHEVGRQGRLRFGLGVGVSGNAIDFPRLVLRRTSLVAEVAFQQAFGRREAPGPEPGAPRREAPGPEPGAPRREEPGPEPGEPRREAPGPRPGQPRPEAGLPGWSPEILLEVGARLAPFVDFTSGLAYDRAEAFASLGWPLDPDWRLDASLAGSIAIDGIQREQATATGQLGAAWMAARWLRLSTGLSGLWQRAGVAYPATSTIRQVSFFLGATFVESGRL